MHIIQSNGDIFGWAKGPIGVVIGRRGQGKGEWVGAIHLSPFLLQARLLLGAWNEMPHCYHAQEFDLHTGLLEIIILEFLNWWLRKRGVKCGGVFIEASRGLISPLIALMSSPNFLGHFEIVFHCDKEFRPSIHCSQLVNDFARERNTVLRHAQKI